LDASPTSTSEAEARAERRSGSRKRSVREEQVGVRGRILFSLRFKLMIKMVLIHIMMIS